MEETQITVENVLIHSPHRKKTAIKVILVAIHHHDLQVSNNSFYVISLSPNYAPGSFTTFPTTCEPFTIFSTFATDAFGTTYA
jgi:hypothetical protein